MNNNNLNSDCVFCKIINNDTSSEILKEDKDHILWEDENYLVFLDINPIQPGHTLVIPKYHIDYIFDMNDVKYVELMSYAKSIAVKLKEKLSCERVCVAVEGFSVPHVHVHLIPATGDGFLLRQKILNLTSEQMRDIKNKILS